MTQGPRWTEIPGRPGDTLLFWIRRKTGVKQNLARWIQQNNKKKRDKVEGSQDLFDSSDPWNKVALTKIRPVLSSNSAPFLEWIFKFKQRCREKNTPSAGDGPASGRRSFIWTLRCCQQLHSYSTLPAAIAPWFPALLACISICASQSVCLTNLSTHQLSSMF
jgi:hypothetical protein